MRRLSFLLKVREDRIEAYKRDHRNVWPEMLDAIRRAGWKNYSLFMRKDGLLFGCFEYEGDLQAAMGRMAGEEVEARWRKAMAAYFETPEGAPAGEIMLELEEVFHLD